MVREDTRTNGQMIQDTEGMREIKHTMKFRVVMMTPAVAAHLLKNNHPRNRRPKTGRINMYAADITNDRWQLTHEAVAIDVDGWLIDGQNRLNAIIDANKAAPIVLVTGVPRTSMLAVDQGMSRTTGDVAKVLGIDKKDILSHIACARSMIYGVRPGVTTRATSQEVLDFMKAHNDAIDFSMTRLPTCRGITQAGVRAVVARAYYLPNTKHERITEFCSVLLTGLPNKTSEDSAAIRLRNWLTDSFSSGLRKRALMRPQAPAVYGKTEAALKAFLAKEEISFLQATNKEWFPLPEEKE